MALYSLKLPRAAGMGSMTFVVSEWWVGNEGAQNSRHFQVEDEKEVKKLLK